MTYPILGADRIRARDKRERARRDHHKHVTQGYLSKHCLSCGNLIHIALSGFIYPSPFTKKLRENPFFKYEEDK